MEKARPYRTIEHKGATNTVAIVDYDSRFTKGIEAKIRKFNKKNPDSAYKIETYKASELENLAQISGAKKLIHTGGTGDAVSGYTQGSLYICHSHQIEAEKQGGKVERLSDYQKGTGYMDIQEDDPVIGEQGQAKIEKYHTLAVTEAPKNAKVIATSKQTLEDGREVETVEALRYDDGSISVQGHPGGNTPSEIINNYLGTREYKKSDLDAISNN
ncbi:MAG: hypothetical protein IIB81_01305 [Nanoarchaeota archaeon]|nr:hypothetical protein [Nanoarchaeota archaeon]